MRWDCHVGVLIFLLWAGEALAATRDRVTLYTPAFQGPQQLGQSVATILNLELWETLEARHPASPRALPFGLGVVVWGRPLDEYSHVEAERRAKEISLLAQLVFWGKVYEYGDGAIAETNLSIPSYQDFRKEHPEHWTVHLHTPAGDVSLDADIPQRRYSFPALVLSRDIVTRYSRPMALEMRARRDGGPVVGHLGTDFTRIRQVGDEVELTSEGKRGWVQLPKLSSHRGDIINFVAGVMRALRGDWRGVRELMTPIANDTDSPNEIRTDAYLYAGLAQEKLGQSGADSFAAAMSLSPNARRCVIYSTMGLISQIARRRSAHASQAEIKDLFGQAEHLLTEDRALFRESDTWPSEALRQLEILSREP